MSRTGPLESGTSRCARARRSARAERRPLAALAALALFALAPRSSVAQVASGKRNERPEFSVALSTADFSTSRELDLAARALVEGTTPVDPSRVEELFGRDPAARTLVPLGRGRLTAFWTRLDGALRSRGAEAIEPLLPLQERRAAVLARSLRLDREPDLDMLRSLRLFRAAPWAKRSHEALLGAAEEVLRRGRPGLALRTYRDVLSHSTDGSIRSRARAGELLSLASGAGTRAALLRAARSLSTEKASLPWPGGPVPAAELARQFAPPGSGRAREPLPRSEPEPVRVPAAPLAEPGGPREPGAEGEPDSGRPFLRPDIASRVTLMGLRSPAARLLLAAPRLIAVYGEDRDHPLWQRGIPSAGTPSREGAVIRAPSRPAPAVAEGRIHSLRGGSGSGGSGPWIETLALDTGRLLWSTRNDPEWSELEPLGDPTLSEGRLYALAAGAGEDQRPLWIVALDAARGEILWRTRLGWQRLPLPLSEEWTRRDRSRPELDPVRGGALIAVDAGELYCLTHAGFVARCDARDGGIDWISVYPRSPPGPDVARLATRRGTPPWLTDSLAVVLPRDGPGVLAFERETGRPVWRSVAVPSEEILGRREGKLVVAGGSKLFGIDLQSGTTRWSRDLGLPLAGRVLLAGPRAVAFTPLRRASIEIADGRESDEPARQIDRSLLAVARVGSSLAALVAGSDGVDPVEGTPTPRAEPTPSPRAEPTPSPRAEPTPSPRAEPTPSPRGEAAPARAGFAPELWSLARPRPHLIVASEPEREPGASAEWLVEQGGIVECLDLERPRSLRWRALVSDRVDEALATKERILLVEPASIEGLERETGRLRWRFAARSRIRKVLAWKERVVVLSAASAGGTGIRVQTIDAESGEELLTGGDRYRLEEMLRALRPIDAALEPEGISIAAEGRYPVRGGKDGLWRLLIDPSGPRILGSRSFASRGDARRWIASAGRSFFYRARDGKLTQVRSIGKATLRRKTHSLPRREDDDSSPWRAVEVCPPWIRLLEGPAAGGRSFFANLDDARGGIAKRECCVLAGAAVIGFEVDPAEGAVLTRAFLPALRDADHFSPSESIDERVRAVLAAHEVDGALGVLLATGREGSPPRALRRDWFDLLDQHPIASERLALEFWPAGDARRDRNGTVWKGSWLHRVAWTDELLVVTDPAGVHAFSGRPPRAGESSRPAPAPELPSPRPLFLSWPAAAGDSEAPSDSRVLTLPWPAAAGDSEAPGDSRVLTLSAPALRGPRGRLEVSHDGTALTLSARIVSPLGATTDSSGREPSSGATWLVLEIEGERARHRIAVGTGPATRAELRSLGPGPLPEGVTTSGSESLAFPGAPRPGASGNGAEAPRHGDRASDPRAPAPGASGNGAEAPRRPVRIVATTLRLPLESLGPLPERRPLQPPRLRLLAELRSGADPRSARRLPGRLAGPGGAGIELWLVSIRRAEGALVAALAEHGAEARLRLGDLARAIAPALPPGAGEPEDLAERSLELLARHGADPVGTAVFEVADTAFGERDEERTNFRARVLARAAGGAPAWLPVFARVDRAAGRPDAWGRAEAVLRERGHSTELTRPFRAEDHFFVRRWQILGPFPNASLRGLSHPFGPESERVRLEATYPGLEGRVGWRAAESPSDRVELSELFGRDDAAVAYAAGWVHCEAPREARLELGSDDGIKVWLGGRRIHDRAAHREAAPRQDSLRVRLQKGWNELLVKVDNRSGRWAFYFELREPSGDRPLEGVRYSIVPPR